VSTVGVAPRNPPISARPGFPVKAMLRGGLLAGFLDGLDAVAYFGIAAGVKPAGIFRYIAGGLIGLPAARAGGWDVVALGVLLHFLIAMGAAASYCAASLWLSDLVRRPLLWGPVFGVAVYLFMDFVVVPLSLLPRQGHWSSTAVFVNEIIIHAMGVGLPIAWFAARSLRNTQ
jgi:hypothetical protein